jgi:hypothetical protein
MSVRFDKIDGPLPVRPMPEPHRNGDGAELPQSGGFAGHLAAVTPVASPPPEVSAEVRAAARAAARLHELGRELRFEQGADGRLRVELRDREGNLLRQVPTGEVFDFAAGTVTS